MAPARVFAEGLSLAFLLMKFQAFSFCSLLIVLLLFSCLNARAAVEGLSGLPQRSKNERQISSDEKLIIERIKEIIAEVVEVSYPTLRDVPIEVKSFKSKTDFFRSQFSISRVLTFRQVKYILLVNPKIFSLNAPGNGLRAIIAHELAHISYYAERNRYQLMGLVRMLSKSFVTGFERKADLVSIERGYGPGLIEYRHWLYLQIPSRSVKDKRRDYFSPEEIRLILKLTLENAELIALWSKNVPRSIDEIRSFDSTTDK